MRVMKKRVLYLHGLESQQGGDKVDFLADKCYVHAPVMDYSRKDIFSFLIKKVEDFKPDLIIGSSMGGYSAYMLGALYKIPIIAFNPAFHSRSFEPNYPEFIHHQVCQNARIILGNEDTVIDPDRTLEWLKDHIMNQHPKINIERVDGMGHRVPFDIFINKIANEL